MSTGKKGALVPAWVSRYLEMRMREIKGKPVQCIPKVVIHFDSNCHPTDLTGYCPESLWEYLKCQPVPPYKLFHILPQPMQHVGQPGECLLARHAVAQDRWMRHLGTSVSLWD